MIRRIVVLPDPHAPDQEAAAFEPIFRFLKFYKPNYLIVPGDFGNWDSVSSYEPHNWEIKTMEEEVGSANVLLDQIDHVLPKNCTKMMIGGNHEARYEAFRTNHGFEVGVRRLKDLSSWQDEYNLDARGWDNVECGGHYQLGKVVFAHGWFASENAAKKMAECFPGRNVIFGHTHTHKVHTCHDEHDLPIEAESIGCLCKFDLSYLNGKPPIGWVHGFMYIDMRDNGTFSKHFTHVIDGKFIEYGNEF